MWTVEYSEDAERDFELIFDHLFDAYVELGDSSDEAVERTAERIHKLRVEIDRLVDTPYIGTLRPDIHPGIRFLRRDKAAIWFLPVEIAAKSLSRQFSTARRTTSEICSHVCWRDKVPTAL
ncbi:toxin-antitoxin system toxin RelE/ParE family protein (plasmid) [Rhizobium etli 8C-3]|uniref:Toxin-antitoxin system toxin RelE/ParE family protein n=1 Tax=Rhizobium etli 8C-3 TaxID=538025 RepID=A0A1L5PHV2_RHIET|nr:toxin-antitoxin system toxin RelE/ParE family protein [Rhizobium etli 8C-3]